MSVMEKLDAVSAATLQAANISEALLPTLSREDIRDLFPGPEHFLRRKAIWNLFHTDQEQGQQAASPNQENGSNGRGLATVQVNPCVSETPRSPDVQETPRTWQLPNPEYVVYTDSELEHIRKQYFEMQLVGQEGGCTLSKELRCRLVRNTVTNMVSIIRATTTEFMYPSKNDFQAMAKRLVEYYPMLRDNSVNCRHPWELLFKQLLKRLHNIKTPKKRQGPTPQRQRKRRRLNLECSDDSSTSVSESPGSTASTVLLDRTRSSASSLDGMNSPAEIVDQRGEATEDLGVHSGTESQQSQARHYHTLQEMYKRPKPNKEAVAQLLDLEFDARRAFINSDTLRDQDRPANILQAYPCFREVDHFLSSVSECSPRFNI